MSETTKVINDIDRLFSEISVNGETFISENYVPDVPETAVIKVPKPAPEPEQVPVPALNVTGQNVSAVELNSVVHDIEDSEARENIRTKTDQLHTDIANNQALITNVENLLSSETEARQQADSALRADVESDINDIKELIPAQASSENKLATKDFVNSSIATNTAYFKGTFNSLEELEAVTDVTNNDYGFVKALDEAGNVVYNRYKYNAESEEWGFEYPLNNSSFTAEQWSAINSGITEGKIAEIDEAISQIGSTVPEPSTTDKLLISEEVEGDLKWVEIDKDKVGEVTTRCTKEEWKNKPLAERIALAGSAVDITDDYDEPEKKWEVKEVTFPYTATKDGIIHVTVRSKSSSISYFYLNILRNGNTFPSCSMASAGASYTNSSPIKKGDVISIDSSSNVLEYTALVYEI